MGANVHSLCYQATFRAQAMGRAGMTTIRVMSGMLILVTMLVISGCSVPVPEAFDRDCPPAFIVNDLSRDLRFADDVIPTDPHTNAPLAARFELERIMPRCLRHSDPSAPDGAVSLNAAVAVRIGVSKGEAFARRFGPSANPTATPVNQPDLPQEPSTTVVVALLNAAGDVLARQERVVTLRFKNPDDTYANTVEVFQFERAVVATDAALDQLEILAGLAISPQARALNQRLFSQKSSR